MTSFDLNYAKKYKPKLRSGFNLRFLFGKSCIKYDKQDRQGKAAFNERSPTRPSNKRQRQGAQEDPKEK
jgi:hypothetical protein